MRRSIAHVLKNAIIRTERAIEVGDVVLCRLCHTPIKPTQDWDAYPNDDNQVKGSARSYIAHTICVEVKYR